MNENDLPFDFCLMSADDCRDRPHEVFSNDIIFILCRYARVHYKPVTGHINPHSPVTENVHYAAYRFFDVIRIPRCRYRLYLEFATLLQSKEELYEGLNAQVTILLHTIITGEATEFEVVALVTRAVLLGVDYYEYGCRNAIRFVHRYLSTALKICNRTHNYNLFSKIDEATSTYDYS